MTMRILLPSAMVLGLAALPAQAVYHQSITVVGDELSAIEGATVSFALPNGEVVLGEVRQDDDEDRPVLLFILPGDRPSAGTLIVESGGTSSQYAVPPRDDDSGPLVLDLESGTVRVGDDGRSGDETRDLWSFAIGPQLFQTIFDGLSQTVDGSARDLGGILADGGILDASISSQADDTALGYGVSASLFRQVTTPSRLYLTGRYGESEELEGSVRGMGTAGPVQVEARQTVSSELDFFAVSLGLERDLSRRVKGYAGVGNLWADASTRSTSTFTIDGVEGEAFRASSSEDDEAVFFEIGLRYVRELGEARALELGLDASQSDDLLDGSDVLTIGVGARVRFQ